MTATMTSSNNTSNMVVAQVEEEYGMVPLEAPNGSPLGGIRDGMPQKEKDRMFALMSKQFRAWGEATQKAQALFAQHEYAETERVVTALVDAMDCHEEACAKKALSKATQKKLGFMDNNNSNNKNSKSKLFWTMTEELSRHVRGISRLRLGNYAGALQDFDLLLEMVSCTEEQPPSVDDHKFAIGTLAHRVECREALMKSLYSSSLSLSDTNLNTTTSTTLLDHLQRSIGDIKEIFQTARTAGSLAQVDISSEKATNWTEFYVTYHARKKVLQAAASNKDLERPVFTAEELRDMEMDMGKCLFSKGCSYACTHCGTNGIVSNNNNNNRGAAAGSANDATVIATKELHLCTGCRRSWFCNRDCQKRAWKRHKIFCNKSCPEPWVLADDCKPEFLLQESSSSPPLNTNNNNGPVPATVPVVLAWKMEGQYLVCARDASNGGRFFDTITNKDVYFVPSERAALDQVANKLGIEIRTNVDND